MDRKIGLSFAFGVAIGIAAPGLAQQAVQWRVEGGGNGHWYSFVTGDPGTHADWQERASANGSHLATINVQGEQAFLSGLQPVGGQGILGGSREAKSDLYLGWIWVTGEPFTDSVISWAWSNPGCCGANEFWLGLWSDGVHDVGDDARPAAFWEWSADCNGDGIVDYGQILDGSFADLNANGVPDCCEAGALCEVVLDPIEWRLEDGGNGHWYAVTPQSFPHFRTASAWAESRNAHLVTLTSAAENQFVAALAPGDFILGGYQDTAAASYVEPGGGWRWVTDEPWGFTAWMPGEPQNGSWPDLRGEHYLAWWRFGDPTNPLWNDVGNDMTIPPWNAPWNLRAIIEWSADCDADGVVDYGQILRGEVADINGNGIPDTCDCPADINQSGTIDAEDLAYVLFAWGMPGGKAGGADINGDAVVDANDLSLVLGSWGPCPG